MEAMTAQPTGHDQAAPTTLSAAPTAPTAPPAPVAPPASTGVPVTDANGNLLGTVDPTTNVFTAAGGAAPIVPGAPVAPATHATTFALGQLVSWTFEDVYKSGAEVTKAGVVIAVDDEGNPSIGWFEGPSGPMPPGVGTLALIGA